MTSTTASSKVLLPPAPVFCPPSHPVLLELPVRRERLRHLEAHLRALVSTCACVFGSSRQTHARFAPSRAGLPETLAEPQISKPACGTSR